MPSLIVSIQKSNWMTKHTRETKAEKISRWEEKRENRKLIASHHFALCFIHWSPQAHDKYIYFMYIYIQQATRCDYDDVQKGKGKNINRRQRGSSTDHKTIQISMMIANSQERWVIYFLLMTKFIVKNHLLRSLTFKIQTISMSDYLSIIFFSKDKI